MNNTTAGKILNYAAMPGVVPRAKSLLASGFGTIAFLMAQIYGFVRLLPANHPYLNPINRGRFGLRHVVAEAANHLTLSWKNIDQIIIFIVLLSGVVLLFAQFLVLIYGLIISSAKAENSPVGIFITPRTLDIDPLNPSVDGILYSQDLAFTMLDHVFGIPGIFCAQNLQCTRVGAQIPFPFHVALHDLFAFYSTGILLIAVLVLLYFIVIVVGETATSGTPFGKRFQNVWVPIRLVMAVGLLVPLPINYNVIGIPRDGPPIRNSNGSALNSGQYILLYAAKYGSGFATNAWSRFNNAINSSPLSLAEPDNPSGEKSSLIALPNAPDFTPLVQFMSMAHACSYAYWKTDTGNFINNNAGNIGPGFEPDLEKMPPPPAAGFAEDNYQFYVLPYLVKTPYPWLQGDDDTVGPPVPGSEPGPDALAVMPLEAGTSYEDALKFYGYGDIIIRFGILDPDRHESEKGNVAPLCGELRIRSTPYNNSLGLPFGPRAVTEFYFTMVKAMWFMTGNPLIRTPAKAMGLGHRFTEFYLPTQPDLSCETACNPLFFGDLPSCTIPAVVNVNGYPFIAPACGIIPPDRRIAQEVINETQVAANAAINLIWQGYRTYAADTGIAQQTRNYGWAGAGIWYNNIAKMNGEFIAAIMNIPEINAFPKVMEDVRKLNLQNDADSGGLRMFDPNLGNDVNARLDTDTDKQIATVLNKFFLYWNIDGANQKSNEDSIINNVFEDGMNLIFGTSGLFNMRGPNAGVHPLAQLSAVGKGLVDSTVRNLGAATALSTLGGALAVMQNQFGSMANMAAGFLSSTALIGFTAGFSLYYLLPFLPFLYFFFAATTWIKAIFEAMVGVPLWALAHLRLDGNGLPGDAGSFGYYLIFDIFLRPILIVFGLVAALLIFTAEVRILNFIWDLVVDNVTGNDYGPFDDNESPSRGAIEHFLYTIIYTIIVYLMATSSFKLIDLIPDNLLRWMGSSVSAFADIKGNEAQIQEINKYAGTAGLILGSQVGGQVSQLGRGIGGVVGRQFRGSPTRPRGTGGLPDGGE